MKNRRIDLKNLMIIIVSRQQVLDMLSNPRLVCSSIINPRLNFVLDQTIEPLDFRVEKLPMVNRGHPHQCHPKNSNNVSENALAAETTRTGKIPFHFQLTYINLKQMHTRRANNISRNG